MYNGFPFDEAVSENGSLPLALSAAETYVNSGDIQPAERSRYLSDSPFLLPPSQPLSPHVTFVSVPVCGGSGSQLRKGDLSIRICRYLPTSFDLRFARSWSKYAIGSVASRRIHFRQRGSSGTCVYRLCLRKAFYSGFHKIGYILRIFTFWINCQLR